MSADTAQETGARLRCAREAKGITLREIADATKISSRALQYVERGDLSNLPGGIFARAFVRSYATHVGLDADAVLQEFFPAIEAAEDQPERSRNDRMRDSVLSKLKQALPLGRLTAAIPVMALALYASVSVSSWPSRPTPVIPSSEIDVIRTYGIEAVPAVPAVRHVTHMLDHERDALGVALPDPMALTLELRPRAACWVALSIDGQRSNSRLLIAGERTQLTANHEILLKVGDAGVLDLLINGRRARPLGAEGEVVTAQISSDNFHSLLHAR